MPPSKASAAKRKGRDPELSKLLKMVLEKLGNDDTDSSDMASDNEIRGEITSRPRRSHVAPRAAFPPVKRRKNGKTAAPAPPNQVSSAVTCPLALVAPSVIPVPVVATPPTQQGPSVGSSVALVLGVEENAWSQEEAAVAARAETTRSTCCLSGRNSASSAAHTPDYV
ncbi:hypothetical protein NDU88_006011 [Pleurodeles waltl]|uniref:Uncharacterized protein n=1 Tax=Pleurodeles waltl TaxID=8319 RepID=A0AAV7PKK9_PLEWA|nr:hypothetical protein NDU88_006011 [Pleurodeles waltl]